LLVDYTSAVRSSAVPAFGCGRPRNASLRWRLSIIYRAQGSRAETPDPIFGPHSLDIAGWS
jgi:hypothetical protein